MTFDSALDDVDQVLALSLLFGLRYTREARIASLSVSSPDLRSAAFADALARFLGGPGNRNSLAIGIPTGGARNASAMVNAVLSKTLPNGKRAYPQGIQKLNDTADEAALIRNGIPAQQPANGVVVLTGPASNIVRAVALTGCRDLASQRVRTFVISSTETALKSDRSQIDIHTLALAEHTPLALRLQL
ncbi:MAG: hypothetical protein ABI811_03665 [Acidobacteriota bacterium]